MEEKTFQQRLADANDVGERAFGAREPKPAWSEFLEAIGLFEANPNESTSKAFLMTLANLQGRLQLDESKPLPSESTPEEIVKQQARMFIQKHYGHSVLFGNGVVMEQGVRAIKVIDFLVIEVGQSELSKNRPENEQTRFFRFVAGNFGCTLTVNLEDLRKVINS